MSSDADRYKPLIGDYLESRGIKLTRAGTNRQAMNCLWHEDGNASAYLRDGKIQCFGCDSSHDIFDCVAVLEGISEFKDQVAFLEKRYPGYSPPQRPKTGRPSPALPPHKTLSENEAREMYSIKRVQELGDYASKGKKPWGKLVKQWAYRTKNGRVEIVDARFETPDGHKTVVSVWTDGEVLRLRGAPVCLWGRDKITPTLPLLIVEGAKCAAIASKALPRFCVATWNQGSANAIRANWKPLRNHPQVFIFPDSDAAGMKAAEAIIEQLPQAVVVPQPVEAREMFPDKKSVDVEEALEALGPEKLTEYILNYEPPASSPADDDGDGGDDDPVSKLSTEGTDRYNAMLFAKKKHKSFCYVVERKTWCYWTGKHWKSDDGPVVQSISDILVRHYTDLAGLVDADRKKAYFKMLRDCQQHGTLKAALGFASTDPRMRKHAEDFDADPWLFNVANGTINLKTGELKPHDPKDYISIVVDTKYRPGAQSQIWSDFFKTVTSGDQEYAEYIMRCVGYAMAGSTKEKCFFFLKGDPDTGKSVFFRSISKVFENYFLSVDQSTWTTKRNANSGHADDIARLKGKRLVITDEFNASAKFNDGLMKNITGGGQIAASQKGEKTVSFTPQCTIWFASNELVHIRHEDAGMWNRLRVLPFDNVIPKEDQDRTLPERLEQPQAKEAILAACVAGCLDWQKQGITKLPDRVAMAYLNYFEEMDPLKGFVRERCSIGEHLNITRKELFDAYIDYCKDSNFQKKYLLTNRRFFSLIKKRGAKEIDKQDHEGNRYWKGISLKGRLY